MKRAGWVVAFVLGVPLLGLGIPVGWIWLASQVQPSITGVGPVPVLVLCAGIGLTYFAVTLIAHALDSRAQASRPRRRAAWTEPMSGARRDERRARATGVETYFVLATMVVAVAADVYLVAFAHPGVPSGP